MYTLRHLKQGIKSPNLLARELNRHYYQRRSGPDFNRKGVDIFEEDWDTLVILDACRYDMFEVENSLPGDLISKESRGSNTVEFLCGNFDGKELLDTVYTTANPQLVNNRDRVDVTFYDEINIWNTDRWNNEIGTVRPEQMTEASLEAIDTHPNKRHVIHYLQPHYPFISSNIDSETRGVMENEAEGFDIWGQCMRGNISISSQKIWLAYKENLKKCLDSVQNLITEISGKTVVTSDHGNMVGERSAPIPIREWGHPSGIYTKELVTVPWLVYESGDRRDVDFSESKKRSDIESEIVHNRLEKLGYV